MWRTKRLLLLPAAVAAAAVAALAALIALTLPASPAGANHVAGATYVGTHSGGGTVEFLVSPDGAGIESFKATNLTGFFCKINQSTHSWDPPLAIDHTLDPAFIDINFVGLSIRGSFPSAGTAEGLVSGIVPPPLGCTSDVFEWTATTAELPTPPPTPTPTPLEPDLVALKTAAPLAVFPGGAITYKVRITNEGESEAQGVQAEDMLPPDVSFVSDTCQGDASNGMWALDIGTLAPGGAVQCFLDVAVSPDAEGQFDPERRQLILENVVSASTSSEESSLGNNTAMAEVVLQHSCPPHGQRQKTGDVNDDGIDDWFLGTFTFTDI
ncbi:MAG: DUF11 domain-containing protein, partial [Dehalococcoidia bacterium]|nr:DUF11 domain-containing protein [Dehalococcoidia bacterium]